MERIKQRKHMEMEVTEDEEYVKKPISSPIKKRIYESPNYVELKNHV